MRIVTLPLAVVAVLALRADDTKEADVITVDPEAFAAEVKKDEKAAAQKCKGKTIEMSGRVAGVARGFGGDVFISLPSETAGILGVSCFLKDKNVFGKVVKGQEVTVRGRYPEFQIGTQIADCVIVRKGPSPALTYTAAGIAREWATDKAAAIKKWKDKPIIVSGEVVDTKDHDVGTTTVILRAGDGKRVDCGFTAFEKDLAGKYKKGEKATIVGEFLESESNDQGPALRFCMPVRE